MIRLLTAYGICSVANAFGTSVGAKTLKLWHAVIVSLCSLLHSQESGHRSLKCPQSKFVCFKVFPALFKCVH